MVPCAYVRSAGHKYLVLAALAGLRSVLTVAAAVLTWLTVWHFSETPFPLFYGWTFAMIFHTLGSAITTACAAPTTQSIMAIWRWGMPLRSSSSSPSTTSSCDASVQIAPVATQQLDTDTLPQHTQPGGAISTKATGHSISTNSRCSVRLLKAIAATAALVLLFAACLVVHGGAVLADWHLARCYLAVRAAPTKQARQQLASAQQSARECAVTLALLFLAPAVSIKWALVMFLGDFSWIPVLSVITSTISYTIVTSNFLASTFIYSRAWTLKHRVLGISAVGVFVLGQFLWRLGARCFLVMKFGGEAYFLYIVVMHLMIGIGVIARPRSSRQAYRDAFAANRIQVSLLTLHGAALASDFTTFYEGLKSRYAASRAAWLKKLVFSSNCLAMLAWRILEGMITYIIILTVHAMVPCDPNKSPVADWYDMCAAVAQQWYVWRPRCWGCSMFDRYYILGDALQRQVIVISMLIPAGVLLMLMLVGLLILWNLLGHVVLDVDIQGGVVTDASTDSGSNRTDAEVHHAPAETRTAFTKRHPPDETEYDYALDGSGVRDSSGADWLTTGSLAPHVRPPLGVVSAVQKGSGFVLWPSIGFASTFFGLQSPDVTQTQVSRTSSGVPLCQGATSNTTCLYPHQGSPDGLAVHSSGNSIVMVSMPDVDVVVPGTSRQPSFEMAPPWALRQEVGGCSPHSFSERGILGVQTPVHSSSSSSSPWVRSEVAPPWALRQEVAGCSSHPFSERELLESHTAVHSSSSSFWVRPDVAPPWAIRQEVAGCSSHPFSERELLEPYTAVHSSSGSFWVCPRTDGVSMPGGIKATPTTQQPNAANTPDVADAPSDRLLCLRVMRFVVLVVLCDLIVFNCHWVLSLVTLVIGVTYMMWEHVGLLFQQSHKVCWANRPS